MAKHFAEKLIAETISGATTLLNFIVPFAGGTLDALDLHSDSINTNGDVLFDVRVNGASLWISPAARPRLLSGATDTNLASMGFDVAKGDVVTVVVTGVPLGGTGGNFKVVAALDDNLSGGGLAEVLTAETVVRDFYTGALGRQPDSDELADGLALLVEPCDASDFVTLREQAASLGVALFASAEYDGRERTDEQFIDDLYRAFLGRPGTDDAGGLAFWLDILADNDRPSTVDNFAKSVEFYNKRLAAFCRAALEVADAYYLRGRVLSYLTPTDGQVITYDEATDSFIFDDAAAPDPTLGGDLSGTAATAFVEKLRGRVIDTPDLPLGFHEFFDSGSTPSGWTEDNYTHPVISYPGGVLHWASDWSQNGQYRDLHTTAPRDFTNKWIAAEIAHNAPAATSSLWLDELVVYFGSYSSRYAMRVNAGLLQMNRGGTVELQIAFDPVAHRWLRLRETAGACAFETSPDGLTWTLRATSASSGYTVTAATFMLNAGITGTSGSGTTPVSDVLTVLTNIAEVDDTIDDGVVLTWDASSSAWIAATVAKILGVDVSITPPDVQEFFADDFAGSFNASKWTKDASLNQTGGRIEWTAGQSYANLFSNFGTFDFHEHFYSYKINVPSGCNAYLLGIVDATDQGFGWHIVTSGAFNDLRVFHNGSEPLTLSYNTTTHRYLRVRYASGVVYWDTSTDGSTWTNRHSETAALAMSVAHFHVVIDSSGASTNPYLDDFNSDIPFASVAGVLEEGMTLAYDETAVAFAPMKGGQIPTTTGAPVDTPTPRNGFVESRFDPTTGILYVHDGLAWKSTTLA